MDVVVLVKYVPDAQEPRHLAGPGWRLDRESGPGLLSELDEYAVEAALQLVEAQGGTVTAVTLGPPIAAQAARSALQLGVDAAVHVLDEAVAGSDTLATARVLAAAVRRLAPDLVVTGLGSTDAATGLVPGMLAELLGLPLAGPADAVVEASETSLQVECDAGAEVLTVDVPLPAVLSVTDRCNEPRYPSFKTIMAAKKKTVDVWSLADLDDDLTGRVGASAARTRVLSAVALPPRAAARRMVAPDEAAIEIADLLEHLELL